MKIIYALLLLLFTVQYTNAQNGTKVYRTVNDFINNTPGYCGALEINPHWPYKYSKYVVNSKDKKLHHELRKCWAIEQYGHLYVNTAVLLKVTKQNRKRGPANRNYHPKGYEYVMFRSPKYLCFRAGLANVHGVHQNDYTIEHGSQIAGLTGALIAAASTNDPGKTFEEERFNYLFDIGKNKIVYFNRGVMLQYLATASAKEDSAFIHFVNVLMNIETFEN